MRSIHVVVHRVWVLLLTLLLLAPGLASPPPAHAFALSVHKKILLLLAPSLVDGPGVCQFHRPHGLFRRRAQAVAT